MIIAQVCLRLATMKGNSKMCSFTVSGGSGGVRKPVSIWCDHHLLHAVLHMECNTCNTSHRVDQVFDWGLWNVGPVLFNGCAKFLDIGRNWNTLSYTPIQSIPNMLNGWHVRWVCWPCKNWDIFSFQELCADPCNKGLCIIMLQHEVMVIDEWHKNGPKDLVTVSLCIQNAINKMYLCLLSITHRHHGPLNPQRWHQQTAHPHNAIHAVCHLPCTVKTGIHLWREHLSKVLDTIECEHLPTEVSFDDELQSGRDPDEDNVLRVSGWLFSGNLGSEDAGCGGPGLVWFQVVCGCESGWMYYPILWNAFRDSFTSIHEQQLWYKFLQSACQLHAPSKFATSVALYSAVW